MKKRLLITTMALSLFCSHIAFAEALDTTETETETTVESSEEELDPVSHIYTFTLNGETYTLPCTVKELTENGWDLGSGTLDANTYARALGYYEGGSEYITFEVLNATEENGVDLSELEIVGVKVTSAFTNVEGYEFLTLDGLCPGMNIEDVVTLYGEPKSENDSYISYSFQEMYTLEDIGELRGLGNMYAGEDRLYVNKSKEDPTIAESLELKYFGITTSEDAE